MVALPSGLSLACCPASEADGGTRRWFETAPELSAPASALGAYEQVDALSWKGFCHHPCRCDARAHGCRPYWGAWRTSSGARLLAKTVSTGSS